MGQNMNVGFNNEKYIKLQSEKIRERIRDFGGKLYLEFGGKLYDDYHASRVLPGFEPDSKLQMLLKLKEKAELIIVINANDIEKNKVRGDLGITYDLEVMRLIDAFNNFELFVGSVVITCFTEQPNAISFKQYLESMGIKVYLHYPINGYPTNVNLIVSEQGYGKNQYIETSRELIVVTAPGPGMLTKRLQLDRTLHGAPLIACSDIFWLEDDGLRPHIVAKPRVGIGYASAEDQARLWRFCGEELPGAE